MLKECKRLTGRLPKEFNDIVRMLIRPYIVITKEVYEDLIAFTAKTEIRRVTDFIDYKGKVYTFGESCGIHELMEIRHEHVKKIRDKTYALECKENK